MAKLRGFEDIDAWREARTLTKTIYDVTSSLVFRRDWALRDQMRRAAVSVMSNIAEGFEREGDREFLHFLSIAKGSAGELSSQLYIALDAAMITQAEFAAMRRQVLSVSRLIGGFMRYLQQSNIAGRKFKAPTTRDPRPETRDPKPETRNQ